MEKSLNPLIPGVLEKFDFHKNKIQSICLLSQKSNKNFSFLALPFSLEKDSLLYLEFSYSRKIISIPIGQVKVLAPFFGELMITDNVSTTINNKLFEIETEINGDAILLQIKSTDRIKNICIKVCGERILNGVMNKKYKNRIFAFLTPADNFFLLLLRSMADQYVNISSIINKSGTLDLSCYKNKEIKYSYPILSYRIESNKIDGTSSQYLPILNDVNNPITSDQDYSIVKK